MEVLGLGNRGTRALLLSCRTLPSSLLLHQTTLVTPGSPEVRRKGFYLLLGQRILHSSVLNCRISAQAKPIPVDQGYLMDEASFQSSYLPGPSPSGGHASFTSHHQQQCCLKLLQTPAIPHLEKLLLQDHLQKHKIPDGFRTGLLLGLLGIQGCVLKTLAMS